MAVFSMAGSELSEAFDLNGNSLDDVYDVDGERIGMDREPEFNDPVTMTLLSDTTFDGVTQGGCTDGEYIYVYLQNNTIIKYKIADGTYTSKVYDTTPPVGSFSHANDMTYNPTEQKIYVCSMLNDGSVLVFDATDLSYLGKIYLTDGNGDVYTVWQFCYDRNAHCYYSAKGTKMLVYNEQWEYVREFDMPPHPNATAQGCETDGVYIYRMTSAPALIDVATVDGTYVTTLDRDGGGESETMEYDWNGNYYTHLNWTTYRFYKLNLFAN